MHFPKVVMGAVIAFLLAGAITVLAVGQGSSHPTLLLTMEPIVTVPSTTTTAPPPTTTTVPPTPPVAAPTARSAPIAPRVPSTLDDAFWHRLSNCESPNGADGGFHGYFQLAGSTAAAVGYHGGSYEEQLAAAKRWLGIIGVAKAGTKAGWPVCWWVALRG